MQPARTRVPDLRTTSCEQRNIWWAMEFTRALMRDVDLMDTFPSGTEFLMLPDDDDELVEHNLRMYRERRVGDDAVLVRVGLSADRLRVRALRPSPERFVDVA